MAVISRKSKFLFIHIAKNGGTSVEVFLKGYSDIPPEGTDRHSSAAVFRAIMPDYEDYLSFAIIRDPRDRFQSSYSEVKMARLRSPEMFDPDWGRAVDECQDVESFVLKRLFLPPAPASLFAPQLTFVSEDGVIIVKHLIWIEEMSTEVPRILGLSGVVGHDNRSGRVPVTFGPEASLVIEEYDSLSAVT